MESSTFGRRDRLESTPSWRHDPAVKTARTPANSSCHPLAAEGRQMAPSMTWAQETAESDWRIWNTEDVDV